MNRLQLMWNRHGSPSKLKALLRLEPSFLMWLTVFARHVNLGPRVLFCDVRIIPLGVLVGQLRMNYDLLMTHDKFSLPAYPDLWLIGILTFMSNSCSECT